MRKLILLFTLLASASLAFGQASVTYTNAGTTGTTLNYLASINTSNNAVLTQSITTEARIVVAGAGTSGLAVLAVSGQANCNMDATISSNAGGYYVIANASTGQCHPQSTAPTPGTWVVGTLASSSTSSGSVALVNISSYFYAGTSVASVTNNDSTLTISPNTGAVIASLNLGNANTWTAIQTITNSDLHLLGSSTGYTTFTSANASATNYTLTIPANTGTLAELNLAQTFSAVQTISASNGLVLSAMTGTACLEEVSGVVTSTGTTCGSGSGSGVSYYLTETTSAAGGGQQQYAANTIILWAAYIPLGTTTLNDIFYYVQTADNSTNDYDLGAYGPGCLNGATSIPLAFHTGSTAGTTFAPSTGGKQLALSGAPVTAVSAGWYCFALTSNAASPTAKLGVDTTTSSYWVPFSSSTWNDVSGGGATLPSTITAPTLNWGNSAEVWVGVRQ